MLQEMVYLFGLGDGLGEGIHTFESLRESLDVVVDVQLSLDLVLQLFESVRVRPVGVRSLGLLIRVLVN